MIIFLMDEHLAEAQFVEDGFVGVAFAVFFEDGFADHFGGHLLLAREVVGVSERAIVIHGRIDGQIFWRPRL